MEIKNGRKQVFIRRTLGFFKSKKEMVAFANNHHAFACWNIDYIWAE